MITRDDALNRLAIALEHSTADQTEVVLIAREHGLTRLANGGIHQNIATANVEVRVRVVQNKRIGVAVSNRTDAAGLRTLVDRAMAIAKVSEANPEFVSLPGRPTATIGGEMPFGGVAADVDAAGFSPEARAEAATTLIHTSHGNGVAANGHVATTLSALAVANSLGVRGYHQSMDSSVMSIMTCGASSGYAYWAGHNLSAAPVADVARRACEKCLTGVDPISVEPGPYTVILEPPAVAEMLAMLGYIGLGATPFQEERSFMSGQLGQKLVGENISLRDDAYHPQMIAMPFDFEGVPKQVVPFFEHGVARGVVYDSFTAQKADKHSTGHGLPAPNSYGPLPLHLVLDAGTLSRSHLIDGVERGILVTRFHYVNIVHPKETILTGMTRDGTFLIEHGSITKPVKNLRFTQSVLEALRHTTGIENTLTMINQEGMYCLAPALRIEGFNFTS